MMQTQSAARRSMFGVLFSVILSSCGGSGGGYMGAAPTAAMTPATVMLSVTPTTITVGQSASVTWSSSSGTSCTATGAWSGSKAASGMTSVTPTTAGSETFTLNCAGGVYSNGSATATLSVSAASTAASAYSLTDLVANVAGGTAANTDPNLVNPWGLSIAAGKPAWTSNNGSQTSTLYDGNGKRQPATAPLIVGLSASAGGTAFNPTGIVFNGSATDFMVSGAGKTGAASFIYDGESGMIAGWSSTVDGTQAITMYADTGGADYKGLAIAQNAGHAFLYATDFHNNKIDVFNTNFAKQTPSASSFTFTDSSIPAGFAPFGIQAIANGPSGATQIYVSYAQQLAPDNQSNASGAGLGYVDIYDTNGQLIKQLVMAGALNAPWGLALAPADFGGLSNALLVGNFGDGKINAYNPASGAYMGTVDDASGKAIAVPGLWGVAFGNDADNQPHNTLFFAAGTGSQPGGSYGRIDVGATPPALNAEPVVTLMAPTGTLSGTVSLTATVKDSVGIAKVQFFANSTSIGTATTSPYTVTWNTSAVAVGQVSLTATATDVDGNVGSSAANVVTVGTAPSPPVGY